MPLAWAEGTAADWLQRALDAFLIALNHWTPGSRLEIVQACDIARHLIATGETPAEDWELLLAELHGIITGLRRGSREIARSIRVLPLSCHARQAQGSEAHALAAIARGAGPPRSTSASTAVKSSGTKRCRPVRSSDRRLAATVLELSHTAHDGPMPSTAVARCTAQRLLSCSCDEHGTTTTVLDSVRSSATTTNRRFQSSGSYASRGRSHHHKPCPTVGPDRLPAASGLTLPSSGEAGKPRQFNGYTGAQKRRSGVS